jgi:DNA-binding response OmpR family regulator
MEEERLRVLIAEDERMLANSIAEGLRAEALAVDIAYDGGAALERLDVNDYDVLILDRDLPVVHGDEVCRELAGSGALVRVLMLTAASDVRSRVAGLMLGADEELLARVYALSRRARPAEPPKLERAGLLLDWAHRQAFRDGRYVPLARKEFGVLAELLRAGGAVVRTEHLLEKVWDEHTDPFTNTVRVTVMTLRRKLGGPPVIETVPGVGYQIR